ncbi:F-box/LRR-repeat/kelch-repeat protein At2g27520-like [Cornus florida]|uniref:F-box/LRR-repeat/kelch-repeat protein At2g27520-like n=1 Tax=Cornus florida TaxID=4283 RepID=UPI00289F3F1B|nr:F-box/LRR-repeat/kelch-repeat protein At2g27520-like [Cornus florida]
MAGVNHISNNFKVVVCSSGRKLKNSASFLPEEIIFNILLWLPAEVLYNVMRYVCREWYNVINDPGFINAHLQKSTDGLLIHSSNFVDSVCFVEINNCDIQIRQLRYGFPLHVFGSCDGLVLSNCRDKRILYVGNPITKQVVTLPPLFKTNRICSPRLTYVRSIGRYKVMLISPDENKHDVCLISTVGTDNAWRLIETKHLPNFDHYALYSKSSFSTGGYFYFTCDGASHIFALDAEAEIFHQFLVPNVYHKAIRCTYIVWKSFLALVAYCAGFVWELWALTELNTGGWTRIFSIDLRGQRCMIEQIFDVPNGEWSLDRCLVPIASLKNGELVIFRGVDLFKTYLVYNLKTGEVSSFVVENCDRYNTYRCHVNSLVSLDFS